VEEEKRIKYFGEGGLEMLWGKFWKGGVKGRKG
jgi:hypothetical protein